MENRIVVIGLLVLIGLLTVVVAKVIGPKLLDWLAPSFNKATNKLDDVIMGKPGDWEAKVREIVEAKPEQLQERVVRIFDRFAKPASSDTGPRPLPATLPQNIRRFFENYDYLSFDGETRILDVHTLRILTRKGKQYLVIGRSEDDDHFYAIDLEQITPVVLLEANAAGKVFHVEEDSPSFEHFVALQHELHLKDT